MLPPRDHVSSSALTIAGGGEPWNSTKNAQGKNKFEFPARRLSIGQELSADARKTTTIETSTTDGEASAMYMAQSQANKNTTESILRKKRTSVILVEKRKEAIMKKRNEQI